MLKNKPKISAMNCHHRCFPLEDFFKTSSENGYKYVEIWTGPQHFYMDYMGYESVEKLINLEKKYNIKIIGICPEQTNPKPNNMASKDPDIKKRAEAYFKNAVDVALKVKANQVVVTSGWAFLNEDLNAAFDRSVKMLRKIADYAENKGMLLAIEALQKNESLIANSALELKKLIDAVDRPALKVCLDIGAMAAAGNNVKDYFDLFGEDVIHAHFVDTKIEKNDTHFSLGDGTRDLRGDVEAFIEGGYKGVLSVECVRGEDFKKPGLADARSIKVYESL